MHGKWLSLYMPCIMINVYMPQAVSEKMRVWDYLLQYINTHNESCVVVGDFNAVRDTQERLGSNFCGYSANDFNDFIYEVGLVDVPVIRHRFSRVSSDGSKMAKLDRFLISEEFLNQMIFYYGPTTFMFF